MKYISVIPAQAAGIHQRRVCGAEELIPRLWRFKWIPAFAGMTSALMFLCLAPYSAQADNSTPLYFSRATATIIRSDPPQKAAPPTLPWEKGKKAAPVKEAPAVPFDVEVRNGMTMYNQSGWFNLSSPTEKSGVLLLFPAAGLPPIVHLTQYAPLDILMIDHQGTITQIVPNIKLSELDEDITPSSPITAFLFLNGGACEKLSIHPGDIVEYKAFKRPPVVLSAPVQTPSSPLEGEQTKPSP